MHYLLFPKYVQVFFVLWDTSEVKNGKLARCDKESLKTSIDICKLGQIQGNFLAKIFMENFAPAANFEMRCPFVPRKSNLTLTNIEISDKNIPPLTISAKYCLDFLVKACFKGEKRFVNALQGRAWVRYKRDLLQKY